MEVIDRKRERERSLLIIGAGGLGQDCADIASMMGRYTKIAFLDDNPTEDKERLYPIVGCINDLEKFVDVYDFVIPAVGNNKIREELCKRIHEANMKMPILIHHTAIVHPLAVLSPGDIIRAMCYVSAGVQLQESVLLNIGCKIDHNCIIGTCSHIPMGCVVRNEVKVEPLSNFKSNAVVE